MTLQKTLNRLESMPAKFPGSLTICFNAVPDTPNPNFSQSCCTNDKSSKMQLKHLFLAFQDSELSAKRCRSGKKGPSPSLSNIE